MKPAKNVIAWTLFELVVLLAFFVYPSYQRKQESSLLTVKQLENDLDRAAATIQDLVEERSELKTKLSDLEAKQELKSKQLPSCIEKGLSGDFLFHVKIVGRDRYLIDRREFSYNEILNFFKSDIEFAQKNGCVHSIWVESDKNMEATDYIEALKKIQMTFYTALR